MNKRALAAPRIRRNIERLKYKVASLFRTGTFYFMFGFLLRPTNGLTQCYASFQCGTHRGSCSLAIECIRCYLLERARVVNNARRSCSVELNLRSIVGRRNSTDIWAINNRSLCFIAVKSATLFAVREPHGRAGRRR